ncbi:hypothetical protein XELAEV_18002289mg [Xenopus laevis]|nr:hypothetical protein XELAEV_18002289mg [Xenopus laevis]
MVVQWDLLPKRLFKRLFYRRAPLLIMNLRLAPLLIRPGGIRLAEGSSRGVHGRAAEEAALEKNEEAASKRTKKGCRKRTKKPHQKRTKKPHQRRTKKFTTEKKKEACDGREQSCHRRRTKKTGCRGGTLKGIRRYDDIPSAASNMYAPNLGLPPGRYFTGLGQNEKMALGCIRPTNCTGQGLQGNKKRLELIPSMYCLVYKTSESATGADFQLKKISPEFLFRKQSSVRRKEVSEGAAAVRQQSRKEGLSSTNEGLRVELSKEGLSLRKRDSWEVSPSHEEPMGMWEEASDTGMKGKKKDKNEEEEERGKKERMVNLTLEMIYLLTGEHYIPRKKSDDGGALHAPGSVIQKENNKNDKKILELMSNIIQLLTGEVAIRTHHVSIYFSLDEWDYIKGNKDLYREEIKEDLLQPRPLKVEYEDKRDIPADLGGTLYYNNEPSKIGTEGAAFCADGNLTKHEISPVEQAPPANGIKEEGASCEGGNQSDCSINPFTEQIQGTDTPTPIMGCSLNSNLADNYVPVAIKEELTSWEVEQLPPANGIKEEVASCEGGNQSDCNINPLTEQIQETDTPTPIRGSSLVCSVLKRQANKYDENVYTSSYESTNHTLHRKGSSDQYYEHYHQSRDIDRHELINGGLEHFPCCRYLHKYHACKKLFPCSDCGKCFKKRSELTVHQRTHTGEKPFCCSQCDKSFIKRWDLKRHHRTHTGEKPFPCSQCDKSFIKRWDLKRHYRTHTGEKPFPCSECGKCFATSSDLRVHRRTHTGEKPFSCSQCGKCFINQSHLNNHQRSHTGEKPYACSECGKCFTRNSSLKIHLQSHAGGKP